MSVLARVVDWTVPDVIAPTDTDRLLRAFEDALIELPYVFDRAVRKAMLAPTWADFEDMATATERKVVYAFIGAATGDVE